MKKITLRKVLSGILTFCMLVSLLTCVSILPASAVTAQMIEIPSSAQYTRLQYTKSWSTIAAGNYRFEMDCKIFSGTPVIRVGTDETGALASWQSNYVATYDEANRKYIITFTVASNWSGNLGAMVGNNGTSAHFVCANPTLYLLDANGNPTGSSLINTFATDYYSTSRVGNKWNRRAPGEATFSTYNADVFAPEVAEPETPEKPTVSPDLIKITASGSWSCMQYTKSWSTIKAGNYRFEMDCKIFTGDPTIRVGNDQIGTLIEGYQSNYVATYDEENYKYIITFTMDSDWEGNLGVLIGNYGQTDLASFACANPALYLLDANGNPTGNSLINTFTEEHYSTERAGNKWARKNMLAGLFTCTNPIPEGYFSKEYQDEENDYSLNPLDKAYITFLFDDQRMPFTQEAFDLFQSHEMPMCCDVVAGRIKENQEVIDLLLDIQSAGGEILSHTYTHGVITSANSTVENIEKEFGDSFRLLTYLGFNVNGIIETGDGGNEKTADYELMETIVRKYYKYSNAYGISPQYKLLRNWLKEMDLDDAKSLVDNAINNKKWVVLWAHDFSEFSKSDMNSLLSYISSKGETQVEVVNLNYVYENFGNYTGPQVPTTEAIESVCATYGHTIKNATVTKAATCVEKGEKAGVCTICSKQATAEIEIDPNNHVNAANNGKCAACDDITEEPEPEPEPEIVSDLVEFYALANDCARMDYLKGWYTFAAGDYRFEMDCKIFSGTPTIRIGMDSKYGTDNPSLLNYKAEYDKANCKYVITFSLAQSKGCNLNIDVGNYETDGLFGCANPTLYLLDSEGNPTGESLINTFNSEYYTTSTVSSEKKDKWRTAGMSGNFTCTNPIPEGYFEPIVIPFCGGDANDDGNVDVRDLVRYKKIMAGILTTELSLDANQDDKVDAIDLSLMRKILLNTGKSSMLYNTYYKLNYTKSLNISYIGGSVTGAVGASTDENGWAYLVTKYLKQKYPNANITESNMGVGGTGSYLGMARFDNNIIENKPDLLFIEFAINDWYNDIPEEQTKQNIEYMINSVYKSNPYADIVFVLITDKNVIGTEFESLKTIKSVAEYYKLPIVDVGQAMWKELNGSIDNWDEYYSDGVHPSDAGHKVYADTVFEKMEELMINGGKFKYKLPEETMCENGFTNVKLLTRDTFGPFKWGTLDDEVYGANWWFDSDIYEKSGCPLRTSYARCFSKILPKYIYPKYDGATLEFTVTGNNIGIIGTIKEGQSITVTLDGNETKTINGTSNVAMTEYPLWNSLENTEHTVKIVANGDGPYIALAAVVVGN